MTQELEANSRELDARRRFTEAILESIPTGVMSITADGRIQRVNRALEPDLPARAGGQGAAPGGSFPGRGGGRVPLPDEARAPHRIRLPADGVEGGAADAAPGGDGFGAGREDDLRLRGGAGRHQRAAARAEDGGLARSGAPRGARDQESADAHRAFGRAHHPATGSPRAAARELPHHRGMRGHHLAIGGVGEDAGGRVLAIRPLPGRPPVALRSERGGGGRAGGLRRPAGRHRDA